MINPLFAITMSSIASALFAYLAFRLFFKQQIQTNNTGLIILDNKLLLAILYGFFTIYAGFVVTPNGATVRLLGPEFVGILAGWRYGVLTSLFGVALLCWKQWMHVMPGADQTGNTFFSSLIVTVLAGYLAGLWHCRLKGKLPRIWQAAFFCLGFELLVHLPVTLLLAWPFDTVWQSARKTMPELIISNMIGMGMMVFVIGNLIGEKLAALERRRIVGELSAAQAVRQSLTQKKIPDPYAIPNMDMYACRVNEDQMSNSFFEYHYCESGRKLYLGIVEIAEITTRATLCMLVMKTLFRTKAKRAAPLQSIVEDLRRELATVAGTRKNISAFFCIVEVDTGLISECAAENYCAQLINAQGGWRDLPAVNAAGTRLQDGEILLLTNKAVTGHDLSAPGETLQQSGEKMAVLLRNNAAVGDVLLLLKYQQQTENIALRIDLGEIERLHQWLADIAAKHQLSGKLLATLKLVLEELAVNIVKHGFVQMPGDDEQIDVQMRFAGDRILIRLKDQGKAFNPLQHKVDQPRQKRTVGGWGLQLIQKSVQQIAYERLAGSNILSLEINRKGR